jgi:hypothetical protein
MTDPATCTCAGTTDRLRAALEQIELAPCAAHPEGDSGRSLAARPLNASVHDLAGLIGATPHSEHGDLPPAA